MDGLTLETTMLVVKVTKHKSGLFEYTKRMLKWPTGFAYIGIILYNLVYLIAPFSRGLWVDLKECSKFLNTYAINALSVD